MPSANMHLDERGLRKVAYAWHTLQMHLKVVYVRLVSGQLSICVKWKLLSRWNECSNERERKRHTSKDFIVDYIKVCKIVQGKEKTERRKGND